jgi:hypothetical protein
VVLCGFSPFRLVGSHLMWRENVASGCDLLPTDFPENSGESPLAGGCPRRSGVIGILLRELRVHGVRGSSPRMKKAGPEGPAPSAPASGAPYHRLSPNPWVSSSSCSSIQPTRSFQPKRTRKSYPRRHLPCPARQLLYRRDRRVGGAGGGAARPDPGPPGLPRRNLRHRPGDGAAREMRLN